MQGASLPGSWSGLGRRSRQVFACGARFRIVSASPKDENQCGSTPSTLGDLLYADRAKVRDSEAEWAGLVRSIAAGDQVALRELYERSHRLVFALALRITGERHAAEEVTLDVFHQVWQRAATYDAGSGTVLGWIMNQARSRAIDRRRFDQRKKRLHTGETSDGSSAESDDAFRLADASDHARRLKDALAKLTEGERTAIETAFFSELSYAQVATQLLQPVGTIKTRIRSGLTKLRRALTED